MGPGWGWDAGMECPPSQRYPTKQLCKGDVSAGLCGAGGSCLGPPVPKLLWPCLLCFLSKFAFCFK